jgi:hypothetical protein
MIEHGTTGLLFPNGDEAALLANLRVVASGSMFPEHSLHESVAQRTAANYSIHANIGNLRRVFQTVIQAPRPAMESPRPPDEGPNQ